MESVLDARERGELDGIHPVAVISSRPDAGGLEKAKTLGVETYVVNRQEYPYAAGFGRDLLTLLWRLKIDLVSQNGWLPLTPESVVSAYRGWIINQHPGPLDPGRAVDFGGKGMFGTRVTAARVAYAWEAREGYWTEATVHQVTEEFDNGGLIATSAMPLPEPGTSTTVCELVESPAMLLEATRDVQTSLLPQEHALVVDTLRTIGSTGNVPVYKREKPLVPSAYVDIAHQAKQAAIQLYPNG